MTVQQLAKASDNEAQRFDYAKRIRELLDQAVKAGHDEDAILELVTGEPDE